MRFLPVLRIRTDCGGFLHGFLHGDRTDRGQLWLGPWEQVHRVSVEGLVHILRFADDKYNDESVVLRPELDTWKGINMDDTE